MKNSSTKEKVTWAVISVLVLLYALFPVASILATSFKQPSDLTTGKFLPTEWSTVNYEQILVGEAQGLFLSSLRNSIGIALIATFIAVVLATFAAGAPDFTARPVFTTPREMKNAHSTSQTIGSAYPPSARAGGSVPVTGFVSTAGVWTSDLALAHRARTGTTVSDTTSDASSEMTTVMAKGRKNEPDWPPTKPIGANTATVVKVELVKFVREGGTLITEGSTATIVWIAW